PASAQIQNHNHLQLLYKEKLTKRFIAKSIHFREEMKNEIELLNLKLKAYQQSDHIEEQIKKMKAEKLELEQQKSLKEKRFAEEVSLPLKLQQMTEESVVLESEAKKMRALLLEEEKLFKKVRKGLEFLNIGVDGSGTSVGDKNSSKEKAAKIKGTTTAKDGVVSPGSKDSSTSTVQLHQGSGGGDSNHEHSSTFTSSPGVVSGSSKTKTGKSTVTKSENVLLLKTFRFVQDTKYCLIAIFYREDRDHLLHQQKEQRNVNVDGTALPVAVAVSNIGTTNEKENLDLHATSEMSFGQHQQQPQQQLHQPQSSKLNQNVF
ncbi:unnamed protein product, partial [Amoebophrya sp. A120]